MSRRVIYMTDARKELRKLDAKVAERIIEKLSVLSLKEGEFGKRLRNLPADISGLRSYRIGNYRVIFRLSNDEIKVYTIGHRSDVYCKLR